MVRLICSACDDEVQFLPKFNLENQGFLIYSLGIGFLEAALNLEKLIGQYQIQDILFIGTAGSYKDSLAIGDIVTVNSVSALNLGSLLELSYVPTKQETYLIEPIKDFKTAKCFSSLEISNCEVIAEKLVLQNQTENFLVENMELYGLAAVAEFKQIPLKALLGITNHINPNAHEDWKANNLQVSEKLCATFIASEAIQKIII